MDEPVVAPRAIAPESGEPLPLADLLAPHLAGPDSCVIAVLGPRGSGKSTARDYLEHLWPNVAMLDGPDLPGLEKSARMGSVVYFAAKRLAGNHAAILHLAPWTLGDWIDYLLAAHPERCKDVMQRLAAKPVQQGLPAGCPELWRVVLDAMARDPDLPDVPSALRAPFAGDAKRAGTIALDCTDRGRPRKLGLALLRGNEWPAALQRLIAHRPVQAVLAAAEVVRRLRARRGLRFLRRVPPRDVIVAAGPLLAREPEALTTLGGVMDRTEIQPATASLRHAAGVTFQPPTGVAHLTAAFLRGIVWPGVDLAGARMAHADLARADLTEAVLDRARVAEADLRRARLHGASLRGLIAHGADLRRADLSSARAPDAFFTRSALTGADLRGALLAGADFRGARLVRADLSGADLERATLEDAVLNETNLTSACLDRAYLPSVDLRRTILEGASFSSAVLVKARLSEVRMPGARMAGAKLRDADLTGAFMPDSDLRRAVLTGARLAHVDWERADLRGANLSGVNFHLGSSRSGLVDSTIASEGTRTGFYTDDFDEMHFRSPEEIRKANLRGADLRGARIENTDFYLVDLRDARYDSEQEKHLRRCGAILRVPE